MTVPAISTGAATAHAMLASRLVLMLPPPQIGMNHSRLNRKPLNTSIRTLRRQVFDQDLPQLQPHLYQVRT
jgi:hypothetical protein